MAHKMNNFWIVKFSFMVLLNIVPSQQDLGDSCKIRRTQESGKCKLLSNCVPAVDALRRHGVSPQVCKFEGVRPVVCCVENTTTTITTTTTMNPIQGRVSDPVGTQSRKKCQEYRDHTTKLAQLLFPGLDTEECEFLNPDFSIPGNKAWAREFPHMAAIGYDGPSGKEWGCVGALISEDFVLTSAHCLNNLDFGEPKYIRVGDIILNDDYDDSMPQEFNVKQIFKHPNFKKPSMYDNIGLIKLDREAILDLYTIPACLETNPTVLSNSAANAGWGKETIFSDFSPNLLKEFVEIFPNEECRNTYKNVSTLKLKNGIVDETQLCAGPRVDKNTCLIGGGILQVYSTNVDCMYSVIGVASFGRACGIANIPDVFTRVSSYIEWIEGIVWP